MDPITLAAVATPFLLKAVEALGEKIWDSASAAAADEATGFGRRLLAKLLRRDHGLGIDSAVAIEALPETGSEAALVAAVHELTIAPTDQDVQAALRLAVRKLLASDPSLMAEVADFVEDNAPKQQAGDRSIQIGGNQSGGTNTSGDNNQISYHPGQG